MNFVYGKINHKIFYVVIRIYYDKFNNTFEK